MFPAVMFREVVNKKKQSFYSQADLGVDLTPPYAYGQLIMIYFGFVQITDKRQCFKPFFKTFTFAYG